VSSSAPPQRDTGIDVEIEHKWFENPNWSDLTIELSDGRKIPVHKSVLCSRNAYFNALCGLGSRFAVCKNRVAQDLLADCGLRRASRRKSSLKTTIQMLCGK
jgi:hypothetical protein